MRWLNSKTSGGHRFFLLKRILIFSFILCFLVVFNLSFAGDVTDPGSPDSEHPWDDLCETGWDQDPQDSPETDDVLILKFGFNFWIMIHLQSAIQEEGSEKGKAFGPSQKNHGHLFIFIK